MRSARGRSALPAGNTLTRFASGFGHDEVVKAVVLKNHRRG